MKPGSDFILIISWYNLLYIVSLYIVPNKKGVDLFNLAGHFIYREIAINARPRAQEPRVYGNQVYKTNPRNRSNLPICQNSGLLFARSTNIQFCPVRSISILPRRQSIV